MHTHLLLYFRTHKSLKKEVEQLKQEKSTTQASLEKLEQCKTELRQELSDLNRHKTTSKLKRKNQAAEREQHSAGVSQSLPIVL